MLWLVLGLIINDIYTLSYNKWYNRITRKGVTTQLLLVWTILILLNPFIKMALFVTPKIILPLKITLEIFYTTEHTFWKSQYSVSNVKHHAIYVQLVVQLLKCFYLYQLLHV